MRKHAAALLLESTYPRFRTNAQEHCHCALGHGYFAAMQAQNTDFVGLQINVAMSRYGILDKYARKEGQD